MESSGSFYSTPVFLASFITASSLWHSPMFGCAWMPGRRTLKPQLFVSSTTQMLMHMHHWKYLICMMLIITSCD